MDPLKPVSARVMQQEGLHEKLQRAQQSVANCEEWIAELLDQPDPVAKARLLSSLVSSRTDLFDMQYRAGFALNALQDTVRQMAATWQQYVEQTRQHNCWAEPFHGEVVSRSSAEPQRRLAFIACLLPDRAELERIAGLIAPGKSTRVFDLLLRSFLPDHPVTAVEPRRSDAGFEYDIYKVMRLPAADKPRGLQKLLRLQIAESGRIGGGYFCYSAALIVCAWDVDDASFRDHPHYPADLVEHYRASLRNTRDAWRPHGAGPGIVLPPPEPEAPVDLSRSKRKGIARWIELVCNGDEDASEEVIERIGKPKKLRDIFELSCALAEQGHAICADIKDDDSAASLAISLAAHRGDEDFQPPAGPPHGPARISRTLRALDEALRRVGHQLISLDNQDDAWHLVAVVDAHADELLTLSATLGIVARPARDVNLED